MANETAARLAILQSLTARLAQIRDEGEVASLVLGEGLAQLNATTGSLCLLSADRRHLEIVAEYGYPDDVNEAFKSFPLDAPLPASEAVRDRTTIFIRTAEERDERWPVFKTAPVVGDEAVAVVPLIADVDADPLGALVLGFLETRQFDDLDRQFLEALAAQCATAMVRSRLLARLRFIADASTVLASELDVERTLDQLAGMVVPRISDWCCIDMLDDRGGVGRYVLSGSDEPDGERVLMPLVARGVAVGELVLGNDQRRAFHRDDLELAGELAHRAAVAIDNARLFEERTRIARSLQEALLPPALPDIPGLEIAAMYAAAGKGFDAGGDFYDAFPAGDGRWVIAIGDVCGKGPEAAAITGVVRHAIRAAAIGERSPAAILRNVHAVLMAEQPTNAELEPRFCTAVLAVVEPETDNGRPVVVACAGHPLPLLRRVDGVVEAVGAPGSALGLPDVGDAVDRAISLEAGDTLVFFTDGITERHDADRYFGVEGVATALAHAGMAASSVIGVIDHAAQSFVPDDPHDDMAALVLVRPADQRARLELEPEGQSASAARQFITATLREWELDDLVDDASLATSELVTNAALHAHTGIELRAFRLGERVRIGVRDTNATPMDPRMFEATASDDAMTGRGFRIVSAIADRWGVVVEPAGKVAWFELGSGRTEPAVAEIGMGAARGENPPTGFTRVLLTDVPVRLVIASELHLSALVREAQLAMADGNAHPVAEQVQGVLDAYGNGRHAAVVAANDAAARGETRVTIASDVPSNSMGGAGVFIELLDTADELSRAGALLTLAALPEVRAFRVWCIEETIRQMNGAPPQRCPLEA